MVAVGSTGLAIVLSLTLTVLASPAGASPSSSYSGDFPDPGVLRVGTSYYAYSTQVALTNIPSMLSPTLPPNWTTPRDALPQLPKWASWGYTWAPSVVPNGSSYLMYYTVRDTRYTRQCISVATSTSPTGPFTDDSKSPLVCQLNNGGSIDPNAFIDASGITYLIWKSDDNSIGHPTHLWGQRLAPNGRSLVGNPIDLLDAQGNWEDWVIEGPSLVQSGGKYYLFYGGNHWDQSTSAIGYATCSGPLGPCTKVTTSSPWMATSGSVVGPQGPSFFTDTGVPPNNLHIAFDAWTCPPNTTCTNGGAGYANGGVRSLWLDTISFSTGAPVAG